MKPGMSDSSASSQESTFFTEYEKFIVSRGILRRKVIWYSRWVRQFFRHVKDIPLKESPASDIREFLGLLRDNEYIAQWQMEQAERALLMYEEFLHKPGSIQALRRDKGCSKHDEDVQRPFRDASPPTEILSTHHALFANLRSEIRFRHYSIRTERTYAQWLHRFLHFHHQRDVKDLSAKDVREYLEYLAVERKVSASTQNQALNALVFLFEQVLKREVGVIGEFTRAKRPLRLPVVLSRDEAGLLLNSLSDTYRLMAGLLYGSGLRLMECVRLRVKDVDFAHSQIIIRDGKGQKDRVTMLPERYITPMKDHLALVNNTHEEDLANGFGEVYLWPSMERKSRNAPKEWIWQYVFPSGILSVDPRSKKVRRHHIHENAQHFNHAFV